MSTPLAADKFRLHTYSKRMLADTLTPVSIYLKLRDQYVGTLLLESSDYHGHENSYSYICCTPTASIKLVEDHVLLGYPDGQTASKPVGKSDLLPALQAFVNRFQPDPSVRYPFATSGLFGYMTYDALAYLGGPLLKKDKPNEEEIPKLFYQFFSLVIVFDHFKNELYLFSHQLAASEQDAQNLFSSVEGHIYNGIPPAFGFSVTGQEVASVTDAAFLESLNQAVRHCQLGDTFQLVVSRRYSVPFAGDDFNVYRMLRSINPSPYLFYFDFGDYKIFGSSPEAQIQIQRGVATLYPIAGTMRRTGHDAEDAERAKQLDQDPKENAEHVMLVDLARNDLSRSCETVQVDTFREIQFYSHVIHLVSKVSGKLGPEADTLQIVADTFPAGTLSGAPKYRAMQLINDLEPDARSFYGGAIGIIGFDGSFNHAILIRSFLSKGNRLHYRAGAGVVAVSDPASELQEVHNKLAALRQALLQAEKGLSSSKTHQEPSAYLQVL